MNLWLRRRRWIDAAVALGASPILVPISAAVGLAVYAGDGHSPTITLDRLGLGARALRVTKFRSMRPANSGDAKITSGDDDRVTTVGAMLRRLRLDELPQLLLVLRGEMAIIGPRPEDPGFVDLDDDRWRAALTVRPGIAGLTQVVAGAWEDANLTGADPTQKYREVAIPAKLAIDQYYAEHASPALDAVVIQSLFQQFVLGREFTTAHRLIGREVPGAQALLCDPTLPSTSTQKSETDRILTA